MISFFWHSIGLLAITLLLDLFLTPPMIPMVSYGQFGFAVVYIAFFGGIMGMFAPLLIVQKVRWWVSVTILMRTLSIWIEPELIGQGWRSVFTVGQVLIEALYITCGILVAQRCKI